MRLRPRQLAAATSLASSPRHYRMSTSHVQGAFQTLLSRSFYCLLSFLHLWFTSVGAGSIVLFPLLGYSGWCRPVRTTRLSLFGTVTGDFVRLRIWNHLLSVQNLGYMFRRMEAMTMWCDDDRGRAVEVMLMWVWHFVCLFICLFISIWAAVDHDLQWCIAVE